VWTQGVEHTWMACNMRDAKARDDEEPQKGNRPEESANPGSPAPLREKEQQENEQGGRNDGSGEGG